MRVRELIADLQSMDPEAIVICQSDSEGNTYSPLSGVDGKACVYAAETTYDGIVYDSLRAAEEEGADLDVVERCVVLFPIN